MDVNGSRIVMPKTDKETLYNNVGIEIRAGYINYNLIISLLKQLFMCKGLNENRIIHDMYFESYDTVINKYLGNDSNTNLILQVLDNLTIMYINRKVMSNPNPKEKEMLDKYQIIINDSFTKMDQNYFAFCALITTDELRQKCMKKFDSTI